MRRRVGNLARNIELNLSEISLANKNDAGDNAPDLGHAMKITIDVNDDRLKQALATLGVNQGDAAAGRKAICEISTKLALEWLLNEKRFETMSQATEHWVASFEESLFPDEAPDPTKLYDRYALPLSKARYLARLLLARRSGRWRVGARKELLGRLREKEADARLAEEQKRISQEFDCVFSRPAYDEFQVLTKRPERLQIPNGRFHHRA